MLKICASSRIGGVVTAPSSKSVSHRALVIASLATGVSKLKNLLDAEDVQLTKNALESLGVSFVQQGNTLIVHGTGGELTAPPKTIDVGNSGTTLRFISTVASLARGTTRLDGSSRMRERPMTDLVQCMEQAGVSVTSQKGFAPISVRGGKLRGGELRIRSNVSSQFISALALSAPFASRDVEIVLDGQMVSKPYIDMTLQIMRDFGVETELSDNVMRIPCGQSYKAHDFTIEGDFSSASYFFALAAIAGTTIATKGLRADSKQGDKYFLDVLETMGCSVVMSNSTVTVRGPERLIGVDVDMHDMPDVVPTLAVVALHARTPTVIRNVAHLRHKECDRLRVLAEELRKIGACIEERDDGLTIFPLLKPQLSTLNSHDDHRMAMSFALLGLKVPGIRILKPGTDKSYPKFWDDLRALGMNVIPENVILTGFRGTGKTTIGRSLAQKMSLPFIDLDSAIEQQDGRSIDTIVSQDGWSTFRQLESNVCREITSNSPKVIATGGGTMMNANNAQLLKKDSVIVLLTADSMTIRKRIAGSSRPSLSGLGTMREVDQLLQERDLIYKSLSDVTVSTTPHSTIDEKAEEIFSLVS